MKTLNELKELWEQLGDVPFNEDEELDCDWLHFVKGTDKYTIWHWFESQSELFSVAEMMGVI